MSSVLRTVRAPCIAPVACASRLINATAAFGMYSNDQNYAGTVDLSPRLGQDYSIKVARNPRVPATRQWLRDHQLEQRKQPAAPAEGEATIAVNPERDDISNPIPGSHPLPLTLNQLQDQRWPLVSPFMPSPQRPHPYFLEPIAEMPHFTPTSPVVYTRQTMRQKIIVPVFNVADGTWSHTRQLDPFLFGSYPDHVKLYENYSYWVVRNQNYKRMWDFGRAEVHKKRSKSYPTTGSGLPRQSDFTSSSFPWGAQKHPNKPWNFIMPSMSPVSWHDSCRMMLTTKMLQGKLQVVDRLTLPEPTTQAFTDLCKLMKWDTRHNGAGVLFMDGGSRLAPSKEFDSHFFYGSFHNGRNKLVRPTIRAEEPFDWNYQMEDRKWLGPKGQKNPLPFNRFNAYDAFEHHLLVITEGALAQLEMESLEIKVGFLPPHIRNQMAVGGCLDHYLLGRAQAPLMSLEDEAAARTEEAEREQYRPYYDDPYAPWKDENEASYVIDAVDGTVRREIDEQAAAAADAAAKRKDATSEPPVRIGSWTSLE